MRTYTSSISFKGYFYKSLPVFASLRIYLSLTRDQNYSEIFPKHDYIMRILRKNSSDTFTLLLFLLIIISFSISRAIGVFKM